MQEYHKYSYDGPVLEFDKLIADHWKGETMATSEKKARSNLAYQFKKKNSRIVGTKSTLPVKIKMVEWGQERRSIMLKGFSFVVEKDGHKKICTVSSTHLNGAVRKLYQMYDFNEIIHIL